MIYDPNNPNPNQKPMKSKKKLIFIALFVIVLAGLVYYFIQYQKLAKSPSITASSTAAATEQKTKEIVDSIVKLMFIKDSSNAVLATITDKTKLTDQKFFEFADDGDYVVVFPSTMQAVIYRSSINKIIATTIISGQSPASTVTPAPTVTTGPTNTSTTTTKKK